MVFFTSVPNQLFSSGQPVIVTVQESTTSGITSKFIRFMLFLGQKRHLNVSRHVPDTKAKQCTAKDNCNIKPFYSSFSKEKIRSLHRR
jgi:hypothetical protein